MPKTPKQAKKLTKKQFKVKLNKIDKFLVKTNIESKENSSTDEEELQQKINDLKSYIHKLLKKKRELECLLLPQPYTLKDIPLNYDAAKFRDTSFGTHTAQLRLKFHELQGCVITKYDDDALVAKFNVFEENQIHVYGLRLHCKYNEEKKAADYEFSKCFVPPMIEIKQLLKKYPILENPKPLIRVLSNACQVFHAIQIQIDQFKKQSDPKVVTIFNSFGNRVIELSFKMVQRSPELVFPVSVELHYDIYKPRPEAIFITSKEKPRSKSRSTFKEFKNHCTMFKRYSLWNAFEIVTNMGLKQHESVFYLLQEETEPELTELSVDKSEIMKKKISNEEVVDQILRDDELEESKFHKNLTKQSKVKENDFFHPKLKKQFNKENEESFNKNATKKNFKNSKVEINKQSRSSPKAKNPKKKKKYEVVDIPHVLDIDTRKKMNLGQKRSQHLIDEQESNTNYKIEKIKDVRKNKSHEKINPEITGNISSTSQTKDKIRDRMSPEINDRAEDSSYHSVSTEITFNYKNNNIVLSTEESLLSNINIKKNKSHEIGTDSVEISFNYKNNLRLTDEESQLTKYIELKKNKSHEIINTEVTDNSYTKNKSTLQTEDDSDDSSDGLGFLTRDPFPNTKKSTKNISKPERNKNSEKLPGVRTGVKRSLKQLFNDAEFSEQK